MTFLNRLLSVFRFGEAAPASPRIIDIEGSYVPIQSLTGSVLPPVLSGSYVPIISLEGSP